MEKKIIDTLMEVSGYDKFVCNIFQDWEFVKDEMLLPERKAGSGNGTIHVYLQSNNLASLEKCFPKYFASKKRGLNISDRDCPIVEHYCHVPNLVALASSTYLYYSCDKQVFDLIEYLKDVLAIEEGGLIKFESIFKLSTDNRPYFKQFSKKVFTRIIRTLFIGEVSAYKISLYQNSSNGEIAAFWQIGQALSAEYIIQTNNGDKSTDEPIPDMIEEKAPLDIPEPSISHGSLEPAFREYMLNKGKKPATVDNYVTVLDVILPRLIREHMDPKCQTLFFTADYRYLLDLENKLWKCAPIRDYDERGHRQLSAGFHRYLEFAQSLLSDEELAALLFAK